MNRNWYVLGATGVGAFVSASNSSAVNTILPVLQHSFDTDIATVEWVITVYLLTVSGLLLTFGRLGDLRGHKVLYVSGFAVFVLGSALCSLAPTVHTFIAFRAVQALGGAMLFANSPAILTRNFPAAQRGKVLGLQSTMTYLGVTVGPSLGGWLASQFDWRAVFYVNIPIGLCALLLSVWFIPRDHPAETAERFDLAGAFAFTAGLVALLLGLNQGSAWGWDSPAILTLLVAAGLLLGVFLAIELRAPSPMLDLTLFRQRLFSAATASQMLNYMCISSVLFLMPFYLIQGHGLDSAQAGLLLTTQSIIMAVAAPVSGTLSDRIGSRLPGTLGMATLAVGLYLLSRLGSQSSLTDAAVVLAIVGLGTGIFVSPNTSALMGSAPHHRQGIASGVQATARSAGMALGIGIAGAVFTTVLVRSQASGSTTAMFDAIGSSFLVASGFAVLGTFTSAARGT